MSDVQILRRRDVERLVGLSKPSLYRQINAGTFPRPVKLGPRAVGWRRAEVEEWLRSRPTA